LYFLTFYKVKIKLIRGHTKAINSCQFIQDDTKIFTCSNDNTARLWDTYNCAELKKFDNLHDGNISNGHVSQENNKQV
jgi:WD40 repeat protein